MISFKQFILEAAGDEGTPKYTPHDHDSIVEIIRSQCSDAIWMCSNNSPLWRGDANLSTSSLRDSTAGLVAEPKQRRSANTSNYYTLIFDSIDSRKAAPKRGRSFIASTESTTALGFGNSGSNLFAILPFNGAQIGIVPNGDLWSTEISIFGKTLKIKTWNMCYARMGLSDTDWDEWIQFDKDLKSGDKDALDRFGKAGLIEMKYSSTFLEELNRGYSLERSNQAVHTTKDFPKSMDVNQYDNVDGREVWIEGKCVFIPRDRWAQVRKTVIGQ